MADQLQLATVGAWNGAAPNYSISGHISVVRIFFVKLSAAEDGTLEGFHNWIANHDCQLVYELAAPVTYQLTPQQMTTLLGTNTVYADCGAVDVTHWPGTGTPLAVRDAAGPTAEQFWAAYNELKNAIIANGGNV